MKSRRPVNYDVGCYSFGRRRVTMQQIPYRRFFNLILISLAFCQVLTLGQTAKENDERAVKESEEILNAATLDARWSQAERILASEYLQIDPDGSVRRKDEIIASIKEWSSLPKDMRPTPDVTQSEIIIRILGEVAIVVGRVNSKQQYASYEDIVKKRRPIEIVEESRFTHVWVRLESRWQLISSHRTSIPKKQADNGTASNELRIVVARVCEPRQNPGLN